MTDTAARGDAIFAKDLRFAWPGKPLLLDIREFRLHRGERIFLRGPSGSGKSTLLGLLGGILSPQHGKIEVLGTDLAALSAAARDQFRGAHLGFIFQMFNLIPYLGVLDNLLLPLRFSPARTARLQNVDPIQEAHRLLEALGLGTAEYLERPVTELSMGQQQRVAAARALLGRPEIIVADEPTSSLDQDTRQDFLQLLMDECRTQGTSLLFVSHDTSLGNLFDRVLALNEINQSQSQRSTP
jgi:putative ABC transport system ATP-binding protein